MTGRCELESKMLDDGTIVYTAHYVLSEEERKLIESLTDEERDQLLESIKAELSYYVTRKYDEQLYDWMMRGSIEL